MEGIYEDKEVKGLTPEKVMEIMTKHGENITLEEAKKMLETVNMFVRIAVNQYLRHG